MDSIKNFGTNVIEGAKLVTPGRVYRGIKSLVSPRKTVATKMAAPISKPVAPINSAPEKEYNQGFKAYRKNLDEALKY